MSFEMMSSPIGYYQEPIHSLKKIRFSRDFNWRLSVKEIGHLALCLTELNRKCPCRKKLPEGMECIHCQDASRFIAKLAEATT